MMDAQIIEFDFSDGALQWIETNHAKIEDMVQDSENIWNIEEWELFERWANNESAKLKQVRREQAQMAARVSIWSRQFTVHPMNSGHRLYIHTQVILTVYK